MSAQLLKITDAQLVAVGAKSQDEFLTKVVELCTGAKASADATAKAIEGLPAMISTAVTEGMKGVTASIGELTTTVASHTKMLGDPATMTEAKIKALAEEAGSAIAAKAIAGTGLTPPAPPSAAAKVDAANAVQALVNAGKYAEAFAADENIRLEFGNAKEYAAFMRANRGGHVKLRD